MLFQCLGEANITNYVLDMYIVFVSVISYIYVISWFLGRGELTSGLCIWLVELLSTKIVTHLEDVGQVAEVEDIVELDRCRHEHLKHVE
jgi:hypothetical protein